MKMISFGSTFDFKINANNVPNKIYNTVELLEMNNEISQQSY